ncbi:hypothetical protein C8F04DRAFT_1306267 [Mycena alexandri]|uniref:Uncharacterized protein n=1 Tax=Mycena alexandri TaxID=1745969 RepID=A0AAD6S8Z5_9AGAR|nr:hypothetical protein C8F04DRAFT_1306267 [Mycena alexandri]
MQRGTDVSGKTPKSGEDLDVDVDIAVEGDVEGARIDAPQSIVPPPPPGHLGPRSSCRSWSRWTYAAAILRIRPDASFRIPGEPSSTRRIAAPVCGTCSLLGTKGTERRRGIVCRMDAEVTAECAGVAPSPRARVEPCCIGGERRREPGRLQDRPTIPPFGLPSTDGARPPYLPSNRPDPPTFGHDISTSLPFYPPHIIDAEAEYDTSEAFPGFWRMIPEGEDDSDHARELGCGQAVQTA